MFRETLLSGLIFFNLVFLGLQASAGTEIQNLFQQKMAAAQNEAAIPQNLLARAQKMSFLFVDGFDFGGSQTNFTTAIDILKNRWHVPSIATLNPTNDYSVSDSSEQLAILIKTMMARDHLPIFLVGHSRGGAEAILTLLRHYDLLSDGDQPGVRYMVAVQSALRGAPLAGLWADVCRSSSFGVSALFYVPCQLVKSMSPTVESLVPAEMDRVMNEARTHVPDGARISRNTFYLRSECSIWQASLAMRPSLLYIRSQLSHSPHQSDGMIPTEWQKFDDFGRDLGILPADHLSILNNPPLGNSSVNFRQNAFEALLETVLSN